MAAATVTSKGQVTLPAETRRRLGIRAGTRLEFIVKGDDRLEVVRLGGSVRDLKRLLPRPARPLSLDEMDAAIARGSSGAIEGMTIALDTNVLVRYIVRDEPRQTAAATELIERSCTAEAPGVIGLIVLAELVWVLAQGYRYRRSQVAAVIRGILGADELRVERSDLAWQALNLFEEGKADLSDYLIGLCGRAEKAEATFTFDRRAATSPLFSLLRG